MGHRFEIYTREGNAEAIINIARAYNLEAQVIGHCESAKTGRLTINSEFGSFEY